MTNDDSESTNRRTILKTGAAAGSLLAVGGGAVLLSGNAAALETNFNAGKASVTNDNGEVTEVFIQPTGSVKWKNFDTSIEKVKVTLQWGIDDGSDQKISGGEIDGTQSFTLSADETGTTGKAAYSGTGKVTLYSESSADQFDATTDGSSETNVVVLNITVELLDGSGNLASPSDNAVIETGDAFQATATNEEAEANANGDANTGMN